MAEAIGNTDQDGEHEFVDELKPGTKLLHGQYTIESFLNSGGFGITYLARDSLDRRVVIKECFPGALCRRGASRVGARSRAHQAEFGHVVERFVQEARSMAKLDHPNIVGVHQVFEDNDTAYMALDYIDGFDLMDEIEDGLGKVPPTEVVRILRKLLSAVEFIHDRSILHRDISPDNILIEKKTGEPLLIDFGAAREEVAKTSRVLSALRVVKDGYSPQEFYINGSKQGPSSDLYALGATFYHLVAGEAPPDSQSRLSALAQDEGDPFVPLADNKKYLEDYDNAFLSAIDKALNVFPKDRIQSAEEWLAMVSSDVSEFKTSSAQLKSALRDEKDIAPAAKPKSKAMLMTASAIAIIAVIGVGAWQSGLFGPESDAPVVESAVQPDTVVAVEAVGEAPEEVTPPVVAPQDIVVTEPAASVAPEETQPEVDAEVAGIADVDLPEGMSAMQGPDGLVLPEGVELISPPSAPEVADVDSGQPIIAEPAAPVASEEIQPEVDAEVAGIADVDLPEGMSAMQGPDGLVLPEGVELISPPSAPEVADVDSGQPIIAEPTVPVAPEETQPQADTEIAAVTDVELPNDTVELQAPDELVLPEGVELVAPPAAPEDAVSDVQESGAADVDSSQPTVAEPAAPEETQPQADTEVAAVTDVELPNDTAEFQAPDDLVLPEGVELVAPSAAPIDEASVVSGAPINAVVPISEIGYIASALLPFSGTDSAPNTVAKFDRSSPVWMLAGQRIVAVNGREIESFDQINPILRDIADLQNMDTVDVELSVEAFAGAEPIQKTLTLEVVRDVVLSNGLTFRVQMADDNQKNTVVIASDEIEGGLLVGDIIIGLMDTGERIDVDVTLQEVLQRETASDVVRYSMLVIRGGEQWVAFFELKDAENNPIRGSQNLETEKQGE